MVLDVNEQTFAQEVLDSNTPVLVSFWAPWCGLCRIINPLLVKFQAEFGEPIKLVSINADENLRLANAYRLTNLPTVLLFGNGNMLHRIDRFRNHDDLRTASADLKIALKEIHLDLMKCGSSR